MNNTIETDDDVLELLSPGSYRALCITNLVLCSISVILGVLLITAMMLPLFYRKKRAQYSTYNLYLVYMSIPDLVANSFVMYLLLAHNNYDQWTGEAEDENLMWMFDHAFDHSLFLLCMAGSLYINSFLAFEIYRLLKNSNNLKRHSPPTISRVTIQAMISYGLGICFFLVDYWVFVPDSIEEKRWMIMYQIITVFFLGVIPLAVLVIVTILIYKQKLVRSTKSMYEGRLKVLFVYFARIVFVSLLHWLPAGVAYMISWTQEEVNSTKIVAYGATFIFAASQCIVSFAFSLTKPDARDLILDLINCSYCLECFGSGKGSTEGNSYFDDPYLRSNLPTGRLFATISNVSNSSTRNNQENKTIVSEQSKQSSSHEKQNLDWEDEKADSNHPQTGSTVRNDVAEEV